MRHIGFIAGLIIKNMKKITILCVALMISGLAKAQVGFGIKGGVNFANIIKSNDDNFKTDYNTGFNAGLFVDLPLIGGLSLGPELMYSQKGYKTSGNSLLGGAYEYRLTSNFIEVPVLLKLKAAGFSIHVGPQVSFLTSTSTVYDSGSDQYKKKVDENVDNLKKNLIGGVIGLGINAGPKAVVMARYAIDLQKNNENGTSEVPEYRNQVYQLSLGIKL
jgi:hypothetical protein